MSYQPSQRPLSDSTQDTQETDIPATGGILKSQFQRVSGHTPVL